MLSVNGFDLDAKVQKSIVLMFLVFSCDQGGYRTRVKKVEEMQRDTELTEKEADRCSMTVKMQNLT